MDSNRLRGASVVLVLTSLVLASGFFAQAEWATTLWPWPAAPLSYDFIASILTAIAVPVLWIALSGELAAMTGGALNLAITYGGMFVYVVTLMGDPGQPRLWPYAAVFGLAGGASATIAYRGRGERWRDARPLPGPVRASFAVFAAVLLAAGTALVLHADIFPWELTAEASVMFGLIYLGAAAYFAYGVAVPRWPNAAGQLAGFLAYDLVLLGPFLGHFGEVSGGRLTSLIVYVAFLAYSGGLAAAYLFLAGSTRFTGR